jgi:NTF2 fold immunity protein
MNVANAALVWATLMCVGIVLPEVAYAETSNKVRIPEEEFAREGFVPDPDTAEKIAEVILTRFYGEANTKAEKPLMAVLQNGVWIVRSTLPAGALGGTAEMHIRKRDGALLYLVHGR